MNQQSKQSPRMLLASALTAAGIILFGMLPTAPVMAQELAEVRVGTNGVVSDAAFFIANRKGLNRATTTCRSWCGKLWSTAARSRPLPT